MKQLITVGKGDEFRLFEDWGVPSGVQVGEVTIYFTDDSARASLHTALYALEMELASFRNKRRDEEIDYHATEGHAA